MRPANDRAAETPTAVTGASDEVELELGADVAESTGSIAAGWGTLADESPPPGEELATSQLRWRLALVAGFLTLFHLVFAVVKMTAPVAETPSSSDAPTWSLLLRAVVAGLTAALLLSPALLSRRQVRLVEGLLFGFEMLVLLAAQYLAAVDLIDRRDLVDAVAVGKNGVIRVLVLMLCSGVFVPRSPAATARIVVTMAAALILCHGMVLHHADTAHLDLDDVASHQIVMKNALFLIMGAALATLAVWTLRRRGAEPHEPDRVGAYRLLRRLDAGGSGEVYLAEHEVLKRPCAVKFARSGDFEAAARFDRETRAAARLSHPNVVAIFDAGRAEDGAPYCAMEYLPGLCAADIVLGSGPMPASRAVYLGRQVCGALAEAHRQGLVHRDLSPANIVVSVVGGRHDVAKVLDFGCVGGPSVGTSHAPVADGVVAGTPEYVAPEQAVAGAGLDARADIYGLGALLYFLVTGGPPFERPTPDEVLRAHVSEPVTPPRQREASVPADLEAVILRCLAKRPEDRFADARAVADALGACACAAEWDEARAANWWRQRATAQA
ncbi:MAG: Serine/threonine-protein kinase PknB [Planctomycetota bacterium]|jgi:serine/threonine-protein kinase